MKKLFYILIIALSSSFTQAGDGGFFLQTCVSESGRTNLTIYQDNFSGAMVPVKVVLGIDGQFVTYAPPANSCVDVSGKEVEDDCLGINTEPYLYVNQGDVMLLKVDFGDSMTASIAKGFLDPRTMELSDVKSPILLKCKEHFEEP